MSDGALRNKNKPSERHHLVFFICSLYTWYYTGISQNITIQTRPSCKFDISDRYTSLQATRYNWPLVFTKGLDGSRAVPRVGSEGFQNLAGRVGSGSGGAGNLTGRGQVAFQISLLIVGSGRPEPTRPARSYRARKQPWFLQMNYPLDTYVTPMGAARVNEHEQQKVTNEKKRGYIYIYIYISYIASHS